MSTPLTTPPGPLLDAAAHAAPAHAAPAHAAPATVPMPQGPVPPTSVPSVPSTYVPSTYVAPTSVPTPPVPTPPVPTPPVPQAPVAGAARTRWLPLATTATAAAVAASLATAALTGAFTDPATAEEAPPATVQEQSTVAPVSGSSAQQPDWEAVAGAVRSSVVAIDVRTASGSGKGSGVIVDTDGHVLTNDHVVGDAVDGGLQVTLADGRVLEATIIGLDPTTDLAVIRLDDPPQDLVAATLGDSDEVAVGAAVMAVGNPLGLDSTVTTGIVSALDRPVSTSDGESAVVTNAIQIDAAVNPGNSGGPLFDAQGRVIGITSSIASLPGPSGSVGSIGLGFAIPVNLAGRIADQLIEDGSAEHAYLGVGLSDGTATAGGVTRRGAVVEEVSAGSPADEAGLRAGDVVVAIDAQPVNGAESLTAFVREEAAGSRATLTLVRDGVSADVVVTFAVRAETAAR